MAYMKTGRVREARTRTKVLAAVLALVLVLALAVALFVTRNPRAAAQMALSDADYASYVLLHNAQEKGEANRLFLDRLTGTHGYTAEGGAALELSKDMQEAIGSEDVRKAAGRYLDKLSFTDDLQTQGIHLSNELKVNDNRQTIFTYDFAFLDSGAYTTVPEYGYGWTKVFGGDEQKSDAELRQQRILYAALTSDDETVRKALKHAAKAGYKAVKKDLDVTIDKDKQLDFQDKHASGDRVNVVVDRHDAEVFLDAFFDDLGSRKGVWEALNERLDSEDGFGSDATFREFLSNLNERLKDDMVSTGVRSISVDLLVDQKNTINAMDALVKRKDGDIILNVMGKDDKNSGPALHLRAAGENVLKVNVTKSSKTAGTVEFALGSFENTMTYNDLQTGDGLVFGDFDFAPVKISGSEDLGSFGLHVTATPTSVAANADSDVPAAFHLLVQTGFSAMGTATLEADVTDAEYRGILTEEDIVLHPEYKEKEKAARRVQYWLVDLPKTDASYKNAIWSIAQTLLSEWEENETAAEEAQKTADETLGAGATRRLS